MVEVSGFSPLFAKFFPPFAAEDEVTFAEGLVADLAPATEAAVLGLPLFEVDVLPPEATDDEAPLPLTLMDGKRDETWAAGLAARLLAGLAAALTGVRAGLRTPDFDLAVVFLATWVPLT